ncbi:MAG TPA: histidinol-phosphate transaminase [Casimicrobiaceae bacterium]|nr:histidinol-phosphate transaminase [Casimicrobiaceae bacterium]
MNDQRTPLAPDHVRRISRYVAGKPTDELARELGFDPATIVKLASNENPRGPGPRVRAAIANAVNELSRYPDSNGFVLKDALAKRLHVASDQIVLGNGSNDILELVTLAFLQPGDEAVYAQHAFIVYPLATQARGARGIEVPAKKLAHDLDAMRAAITPRTRVVFIANPNNPTGTWITPDDLHAFVESIPPNIVVVIDEAYNEYLAPSLRAQSIAWLATHRNLVVSRTFSKAYGLASLRVGYGVMHVDLADLLNRVRQPFNVNAIAQVAALAALDDDRYVEESRELNARGYAQLTERLGALDVRFVPSHGNFLLVDVGDGARANQELLQRGVIVRPVANYGLPEYVRVTIGLPDENTRFLDALAEALGKDRQQ